MSLTYLISYNPPNVVTLFNCIKYELNHPTEKKSGRQIGKNSLKSQMA